MSDLRIHREPAAIDGLKLLWEKLLGETRCASFTQSWHWYRVVSRLVADRFAPLVLEARHSSGTLGLLPLLSDRKRPRWISPQLIFGLGNAAPIGSQPTASWLILGRHLRDQLPGDLQWHLGPFPHGTGTASRLSTAFDQLVIPQVADRRWQVSEIDLQQSGLRWRPAHLSEGIAATADNPWRLSFSQPLWEGGDETDWQAFDSIAPLIPGEGVAVGSYRRRPQLSLTQLEHLYGELSSAGLAHVMARMRSGKAEFGVLLLGDQQESILVPLVGEHPSPPVQQTQFLTEALGRMRAHGFCKTTLLGNWRKNSTWQASPRTHYAYWFASQWNTHIAFKQLWHRMVPAGDLKTAP